MRGGIDWFMGAPQESLATQANHYWANAPGRLIGAADRFRRASGAGLGPLRANINEVVTFIDFESAGLNRVNLIETKYQASPKQVNYLDHYADLERDDRGYIQRITVDGQSYLLKMHTNGVVTNITTSLLSANKDSVWTFRDTPRQFNILANDSRLEGGPVQLACIGYPAHGSVSTNNDGTVVYSPTAGFTGYDSFTYSVTAHAGGSASATCYVEVVDPASATGTMLVEYWFNIGSGTAVSDLTGNANFPNNPTVKFYTNSSFELRSNHRDSYGSRARAQFIAPTNGSYTFWIASDDSSELWFSTNTDRENKVLIAYVSGWTNPRGWTKFASQQSAPIVLAAGQACYLEALHKEGTSLDNLAVAWRGPAPFDTTTVIPATLLRQPFAGFSAPRFSNDPLQKPYAVLNLPYAASLADDVTDTNPNETLVFTKVAGPAWLNVAASGALSGTPALANLGMNSFTVRVTAPTGFVGETMLRVFVWDPAPPGLSAGFVGASFQMQLTGTSGQHYRIEYQPVLPPAGLWQVLTDITSLSVSPLTICAPATNAQQFYRALSSP